MPSVDVPFFGNLVILLVAVSAAYTFAVAIASARGRPHLLVSARFGSYATCALVAVAVLVLAYAFQTHDFRIRYVGRYSDRSMAWWYLITSLWGGQDGSLLWWTFLLSLYTGACTRWLRGRYVELQPYVLATLMSIFFFFCVLMLFAANPFYVSPASLPSDGEGLNPLLQNYWMIIHPPSLYTGFVGWSVPFAFMIAALVTGRLNEEWIYASRRWALVAWLFLSFGNMLGASWSYEELGWGGYWAWDPVENAAILPWFTATAFLHSVMIQERYGMLKVWNVFLLWLTFFLTIFGTFLTRSGLIASVHSFARSDIGVYFVGYMVLLAVAFLVLVVWRLPDLRRGRMITLPSFLLAFFFFGPLGLVVLGVAKVIERLHPRRALHREGNPAQLESLVSREGAFLFNNWVMLGITAFVVIATTFPLVSEWYQGEPITFGASYYNKWMVPLGLILLFLTGVGPLISWRRATGKGLLRAFWRPVNFAFLVGFVHFFFGGWAGFPWRVESDEIYDTAVGEILAKLYAVAPLFCSMMCAFVTLAIVQEFQRGVAGRRKSTGEGVFTALLNLTFKAKRRYGGYIVHIGIVLMFLGFCGAAYDTEREGTLRPTESLTIGPYRLRYDGVRREEDPNKAMIFTKVSVFKNGTLVDTVWPAKFIYRTHPDMPTTEVAIRTTGREDLYVIMSAVSFDTQVATFKAIIRPLVVWVWIGGAILLLGTIIAMSPSMKELLGDGRDRATKASGGRSMGGRAAAAAAAILLGLLIVLGASRVFAQSNASSSLHAGTVSIRDPKERRLFEKLLCMCGDCQRLPLSTCGCSDADDLRDEIRARIRRGETVASIVASYRERFGAKSVAVPPDEGLGRLAWGLPVAGFVLAVLGLTVYGSSLRKQRAKALAASAGPTTPAAPTSGSAPASPSRDALDARIDAELEDLEGP